MYILNYVNFKTENKEGIKKVNTSVNNKIIKLLRTNYMCIYISSRKIYMKNHILIIMNIHKKSNINFFTFAEQHLRFCFCFRYRFNIFFRLTILYIISIF